MLWLNLEFRYTCYSAILPIFLILVSFSIIPVKLHFTLNSIKKHGINLFFLPFVFSVNWYQVWNNNPGSDVISEIIFHLSYYGRIEIFHLMYAPDSKVEINSSFFPPSFVRSKSDWFPFCSLFHLPPQNMVSFATIRA